MGKPAEGVGIMMSDSGDDLRGGDLRRFHNAATAAVHRGQIGEDALIEALTAVNGQCFVPEDGQLVSPVVAT